MAQCQPLLYRVGLECCLEIGKNLLSLSSSSTTFSVLPALELEEPSAAVGAALGGILSLGLRVILTVALTGLVVVLTVAFTFALELVVRGTLIGVQPEDMNWSCEEATNKLVRARFGFGEKCGGESMTKEETPAREKEGRVFVLADDDREFASVVQPRKESSEFSHLSFASVSLV